MSAIATDGGAFHNCALSTTNEVICWGGSQFSNVFSFLGYPGTTENIGDSEPPNSGGVVDVAGPGTTVTQLTTGQFHTCALLSDGNVRCWGRGTDGALGYGNLNEIGDDEVPSNAGNVPVRGTVTKLVAGWQIGEA